jgi:hypothetical protein
MAMPCTACAAKGAVNACVRCTTAEVERADLVVRYVTNVPKKIRQQDKTLD